MGSITKSIFLFGLTQMSTCYIVLLIVAVVCNGARAVTARWVRAFLGTPWFLGPLICVGSAVLLLLLLLLLLC